MPIVLFITDYVSSLTGRFLPKRKLLARFRASWGQPGDGDGLLASRYLDLIGDANPDTHVDDGTWNDLEFPEIFSRMDTTVTAVGSQVLYRQLRTFVDDPRVLQSRYAAYARLRSDSALRERIQLLLAGLDHAGSSHVSSYLFGALPKPGKYRSVLKLWAVLSIAIIVLAIPLALPAWLFVPVLAINFFVTVANASNVHWQMDVLKSCVSMLPVADRLATMHAEFPSWPQLAGLADEKNHRQEFKRALGGFRTLIRVDAASKAPVVEELANAAKALLLIEVLVCSHAMKRFARVRATLAKTFELVGEVDAAIAVASWLEQCDAHCQPELVDDRRLAIIDGYHPLLAHGVSNSVQLQRRSALVTGSNMAGKTTFIKMIGTNMILGRTLGMCMASAAVVPKGQVMASVHNRHSVESGKSHYFAEIEAIKTFLRYADAPGLNVFLIDEPFNGTNTIERIATARAVLEALARNALVFVTTHDVELQAFLDGAYELYHFQENPDVEGFFDFRLKAGASRNRNAIRLLERVGFPPDIVGRAMRYAAADTHPESGRDRAVEDDKQRALSMRWQAER